MLVKCHACGSHVPAETTIEVPRQGQMLHFCSARCADAETAAGALAPLGPLPAPPRRLLVAVDGSGPSIRAVEWAASFAALTRGEVRLLYAVDSAFLRAIGVGSPEQGAPRLGVRPADVAAALHEDAEKHFARCRRICEAAGVPCSSHVEFRPPVDAIADAAREADLVVMGSRGMGAVSGAVLGSLSHRVLGSVKTPVLVVH
jgi:nucleotide-binding universal stress UspA family protein